MSAFVSGAVAALEKIKANLYQADPEDKLESFTLIKKMCDIYISMYKSMDIGSGFESGVKEGLKKIDEMYEEGKNTKVEA